MQACRDPCSQSLLDVQALTLELLYLQASPHCAYQEQHASVFVDQLQHDHAREPDYVTRLGRIS